MTAALPHSDLSARTLHVVLPWSTAGADRRALAPRAWPWWPTVDGSDAAVLACRAALDLEHADAGNTLVALVGGSTAEARAHELGLGSWNRVLTTLGRPELAWRGLARLLRVHGPFSRVVCWGGHAGLTRAIRWAVASLPRSVRAPSPPVIVSLGPDSVLSAGPVPAALQPDLFTRTSLRTRLGIRPEERACLLLADPPSLGDANILMYVLGLLENTGEHFVGLCSADSNNLARARNVTASIGLRTRLIQSPRALWSLLPACDVALVVPPAAYREACGVAGPLARHCLPELGALRVLCAGALAVGIPVVAPRGRGLDDLFSREQAALWLAESCRNAHLARRLLRAAPLELAESGNGCAP